MVRVILRIVTALAVFTPAMAAQSDSTAIYISSSEVQAIRDSIQSKDKGIAFRVVDVGNAYVGIAIRHRPKTAPDGPVIHLKVTEVYIITAGAARLATGGVMSDEEPMKSSGEGVGPSLRGMVAKPNDVRPITGGDIIIIPKGMPHWFTEVSEDLTYLVVRVDPERSMALK